MVLSIHGLNWNPEKLPLRIGGTWLIFIQKVLCPLTKGISSQSFQRLTLIFTTHEQERFSKKIISSSIKKKVEKKILNKEMRDTEAQSWRERALIMRSQFTQVPVKSQGRDSSDTVWSGLVWSGLLSQFVFRATFYRWRSCCRWSLAISCFAGL